MRQRLAVALASLLVFAGPTFEVAAQDDPGDVLADGADEGGAEDELPADDEATADGELTDDGEAVDEEEAVGEPVEGEAANSAGEEADLAVDDAEQQDFGDDEPPVEDEPIPEEQPLEE